MRLPGAPGFQVEASPDGAVLGATWTTRAGKGARRIGRLMMAAEHTLDLGMLGDDGRRRASAV